MGNLCLQKTSTAILNEINEKEWYVSNAYLPLWKKFIKAVNAWQLPEIR